MKAREVINAGKGVVTRALTENLGLKLTALVITMLLYILVRFQEEGERLVDVEVLPQLPQPSSGLVLTSPPPTSLRLRLAGPRSRINALRSGDIPQVEIDLTRYGEGTSYYYFNAESFEIPSGLTFVHVNPLSFPIKIERLVSRRLPVRVRTIGHLAAGVELIQEPKATPDAAVASGPSSVIRDLKFLETEDVDMEGLAAGEYSRSVPLRRTPEMDLRAGDLVTVTLRLRWKAGERALMNVPVKVSGTELQTESTPTEVDLALSGPEVFLTPLDPKKIHAVAEVLPENALQPGSVRIKLGIAGLPESITVKSITPEFAQVRLRPQQTVKPNVKTVVKSKPQDKSTR